MTDIFDTKIICKRCGIEMKKTIVEKNGLQLRAVACPKCNDKIVHPSDANELKKFGDLRGKTFNVKLRMVGNSHAISIPKEIVDFMSMQRSQMKQHMDNMVRLCLEDFKRMSLMFGNKEEIENEEEIEEGGEDEEN